MDPGPGSCTQLTSGQDTWSARCVETGTAGAAGGPGKPTGSNPGRAPRSDPTLHDHQSYPAQALAGACHWRWAGSETALKEAKSAISGAGPSTGPMLRSQSPALVAQEHAAWVTAVELARAVARAAAAIAVPARRGRRAGQPVHPRQVSFTAARRAVIASVRSGAAAASLPASLITANRCRILAGLARRRVTVDRNRHRDRTTKARPGFPAGGPRLPTRTAPAQISVCQPLAA
jgi:hypothetical protein